MAIACGSLSVYFLCIIEAYMLVSKGIRVVQAFTKVEKVSW